MKLINYITDSKVDSDLKEIEISDEWNVRLAVRAVLLDDRKCIALMHIAKYNVYKLPGGGVDEGEDLNTAFVCEMMEETGCNTDITNTIGITIEKRDQWNMFQISHCYVAQAEKVKNLELTDEEKESGFSLHWIDSIDKALNLIGENSSDRYDDKYIKERDYSILQKAKELLKNS